MSSEVNPMFAEIDKHVQYFIHWLIQIHQININRNLSKISL